MLTNRFASCLEYIRSLGWHNSQQRKDLVKPGVVSDIYDTKLWKHFSSDRQMQAGNQAKNFPDLPASLKTGTGLNMAFVGCDDGVAPWRSKKAYNYNPIALGCLNLPPWLRHQSAATNVAGVIPGNIIFVYNL